MLFTSQSHQRRVPLPSSPLIPRKHQPFTSELATGECHRQQRQSPKHPDDVHLSIYNFFYFFFYSKIHLFQKILTLAFLLSVPHGTALEASLTQTSTEAPRITKM